MMNPLLQLLFAFRVVMHCFKFWVFQFWRYSEHIHTWVHSVIDIGIVYPSHISTSWNHKNNFRSWQQLNSLASWFYSLEECSQYQWRGHQQAQKLHQWDAEVKIVSTCLGDQHSCSCLQLNNWINIAFLGRREVCKFVDIALVKYWAFLYFGVGHGNTFTTNNAETYIICTI